jgi:hypothetical protein
VNQVHLDFLVRVRYLASWLGKPITFVDVLVEVEGYPATGPVAMKAKLVFVSEFYLTVQLEGGPLSIPLGEVKLSWDDERAQPKLIAS